MNLKNKKIVIISVVVVIVIAIIIIVCCNMGVEKIENNIVENEIIPEEEISDEQLRETTISLYFINENNEITAEIRKIDSKNLLNNPYQEVMNLLLEGPKYNNLKSAMPEGVKVNSIKKSGECLIIDFSKEFIENQVDDVEMQGLVISQIVDTMTQFTEINSVKILIDGEENQCFKNGNIKFEQIFIRED